MRGYIFLVFIEADISICCSISLLIGEYQRVKGGSESCHHDTDHDMVHIHVYVCVHSLASLPPFRSIHSHP